MLQHLILEAEEGDLDNFRKVYDRLDTFHKTSDVASDTDKADIYQNVVARKLACHVLAYVPSLLVFAVLILCVCVCAAMRVWAASMIPKSSRILRLAARSVPRCRGT